MQKNVTILSLPPHSSHFLQPLDLNFFHCFKMQLRKALHQSKKELTKWDAIKLLTDPWQIASTQGNIKKAFELSGIMPLNFQRHLIRFQKTNLSIQQILYKSNETQKVINLILNLFIN